MSSILGSVGYGFLTITKGTCLGCLASCAIAITNENSTPAEKVLGILVGTVAAAALSLLSLVFGTIPMLGMGVGAVIAIIRMRNLPAGSLTHTQAGINILAGAIMGFVGGVILNAFIPAA